MLLLFGFAELRSVNCDCLLGQAVIYDSHQYYIIFDRGFIGFEDTGQLIISPVAHLSSLHRMGIDTAKAVNVGPFTSRQKQFLDFHRNAVLLQSARK